MTSSRISNVLAILQESFNPREEGWLWLALHSADDREGGVLGQFEGAYDEPVAAATGLAQVLNECRADRAYLALCRREARPTEGDRQLWGVLRNLVADELLTDMVVFNGREAWSMRAEGVAAA